MIGIPNRRHMYIPRHFGEPSFSDNEDFGRRPERLLANLRQRQAAMFGGHHPRLAVMGACPPPCLGGRGMEGGYLGRGTMMGMGMGFGMPVGVGLGMGMRPAMGIGIDHGFGMEGRLPFDPSPYAHSRRPRFGYQSSGPPRAHSFHSPYSGSHCSRFSSIFEGTEDDFDDEYRMTPRYSLGQRNRGAFELASRHLRGKRRYWPGAHEDNSDDEYDDYKDYWDDDDEYNDYYGSSRRRPRHAWWLY